MTTTDQSNSDKPALKAAIFQRLHPKTYLQRFLAESVRPDGRAASEWRPISVITGSISTANGSALVRMGGTTIVCGVKAEIAEPELDREHEGFLVPNLDLPAMCSPKFKPGPPSEEAQVLSARLNDAIITSGILPLSSLCIHPGKSAWVLYVDALCINYDGNAFDATLLAMITALKNTTLPKATYNEDTGLTACSRKVQEPLQLLPSSKLPASFSFGVFDSAQLLFDPTSFEEPLLETTVSVVLNADGEIVSVNQVGLHSAAALEGDLLSSCISAAAARRKDLAEYL